MITTTKSGVVVQLDWSDEDGIVTVTPRDESRFAVQMRHAIEALQQADKLDKFREQLRLLLESVAGWLARRNDVDAAYLTMREGRLLLIVVRNVAEYDEAFEDDLSELDLALAGDASLDLVRLGAISLPSVSESALESFLDPAFTLELQWHPKPTT